MLVQHCGGLMVRSVELYRLAMPRRYASGPVAERQLLSELRASKTNM